MSFRRVNKKEKTVKASLPDRYRRLLLVLTVVALLIVYVVMIVNLMSIGYDRLPGNDPAVMLRGLPYDLVIGALLYAVGAFVKSERRKTKKVFQFIGLWCIGISLLIGFVCLVWMLIPA